MKPSIVQVNLATCCVVPPALQEFSKQNDIQLNTTSDPAGNSVHQGFVSTFDTSILTFQKNNCFLFVADILPKDMLKQVLEPSLPFNLVWVFRYQVQVKCRGVLASKGYVVRCEQSG